jgi:hypothetical protein
MRRCAPEALHAGHFGEHLKECFLEGWSGTGVRSEEEEKDSLGGRRWPDRHMVNLKDPGVSSFECCQELLALGRQMCHVEGYRSDTVANLVPLIRVGTKAKRQARSLPSDPRCI